MRCVCMHGIWTIDGQRVKGLLTFVPPNFEGLRQQHTDDVCAQAGSAGPLVGTPELRCTCIQWGRPRLCNQYEPVAK